MAPARESGRQEGSGPETTGPRSRFVMASAFRSACIAAHGHGVVGDSSVHALIHEVNGMISASANAALLTPTPNVRMGCCSCSAGTCAAPVADGCAPPVTEGDHKGLPYGPTCTAATSADANGAMDRSEGKTGRVATSPGTRPRATRTVLASRSAHSSRCAATSGGGTGAKGVKWLAPAPSGRFRAYR